MSEPGEENGAFQFYHAESQVKWRSFGFKQFKPADTHPNIFMLIDFVILLASRWSYVPSPALAELVWIHPSISEAG